MSERVLIETLTLDPLIQPRELMDAATIDDYGEALEEGAEFPPIVVFWDEDGTRWLADGFHRVYAHVAAGREDILADLRPGTKRDALLYAAGANAGHGLRRTNSDKRRAVARLLKDVIWRDRKPDWIAERCAVSARFVYDVRASVEAEELKTNGANSARSAATEINARGQERPTRYATSAAGVAAQTQPPSAPPATAPTTNHAEEKRALQEILALAVVTRYDPLVVAGQVPRASMAVTVRTLDRLTRWMNGVSATIKGNRARNERAG